MSFCRNDWKHLSNNLCQEIADEILKKLSRKLPKQRAGVVHKEISIEYSKQLQNKSMKIWNIAKEILKKSGQQYLKKK